jgi:uncharacterized SAM-dependent methyltransferase
MADSSVTTESLSLPLKGVIEDIGGSNMAANIQERLKRDFLANEGTKPVGGVVRRAIPASLMYYENGFERWKDVTAGPQFYQTRVEIELLEHYGAQIVELIEPGSLLIDLGSG